MPIGTLTQNTARQSHSDSTPPMSRPRKEPATAATILIPSAVPRCLAGKASVRMAVELAISMAPPIPWNTRQMMIHIAPALPCKGSKDSATAVNAKTAKPRL
jgi:hypothetical protein